VFLDPVSEAPYKLHFFELAIRGQNTKGEAQTLHGERRTGEASWKRLP